MIHPREAFLGAFPTSSFHSQLPSSAVLYVLFCRAENRATQTRIPAVSLPTSPLWHRTRAPRREVGQKRKNGSASGGGWRRRRWAGLARLPRAIHNSQSKNELEIVRASLLHKRHHNKTKLIHAHTWNCPKIASCESEIILAKLLFRRVRCGRADGAPVYYVNDYVPETERCVSRRPAQTFVAASRRRRSRGCFYPRCGAETTVFIVLSPESWILRPESIVLSPHFSVRCGRSSEGCPPSRSCFTTGHRQQQSLSSESLPFYQPRNTRFTSIRKQAFEALNMDKLV